MTDNFTLYKEYITKMGGLPQSNKTGNADKFYVIELNRRGKDNPDMSAANYHFRNYYIYSWEDYDRYIPEIKQICNALRMRAYASVNWKSTKQIAMNTIAAMAKRAAMGDFKKIYKEWESQTGQYSARNENIWLIDLDDIDLTKDECWKYVEYVKLAVSRCRSQFADSFIMQIPTRSGLHLLYRPFSLDTFEKECKTMGINLTKNDIKQNHLTLLYENLN